MFDKFGYIFIVSASGKSAFEMLSIGELDEFLPKNQGQPDKNHYQSFSVEFITRILKAFISLKSRTNIEVKKLLPSPVDRPVTEDEKENITF